MKLAKGTALVTGLALAGGCGDDPPSRPAASSFEPSAAVRVSDSAPGVAAGVTFETALAGSDELIGSQLVHVPGGWSLKDAPNGDIVGAGVLELDRGCDGTVDSFDFDLVRQQPPSDTELTAWRAAIPGLIDLLFRVDALDAGGYDISLTFPWDFYPDVRACTPGSFNFTVAGASSSGAPVVTNPPEDGAYTFQLTYGTQPRAQLSIRDECVAIGSGACPTGEG